MIADLDGDKAAAAAASIAAETGADCLGQVCDVTKTDQIEAVVAATVTAFGGLSTLVNNVGWGGRQDDPTAIPDEEFIASYRLNTISAYRMSMACLPHLLAATNATITNSGSFSSAIPAYDILPYATAKAALNQIVRTAAIELARSRPQAVCVALHPGTVDTGLSKPFQRGVPAEKLFTPDYSAERLLAVLDGLTPAQSGRIFAWDGSEIAP